MFELSDARDLGHATIGALSLNDGGGLWLALVGGALGALCAAAALGLLKFGRGAGARLLTTGFRLPAASDGPVLGADALPFRVADGALEALSRAARAFQGGDRREVARFVDRLTPVEGPADLGRALWALETDGRAFRLLADDESGRAWEVTGAPHAGEARVLVAPAGPARREMARLRAMLSVLADERDVAQESLETAPALIWRRDAAGRVTWANARYRRMVGADSPDAESLRDPTVPLPDLRCDSPGAAEAGSGSALRQRLVGRRAVFDARTGERRWFELSEVAAADGGTLGFGVDAAAAVHAEGALRRFVETLTETFAHLRIGLAIFDRETRLGLFNPAFAELMRLDPAWLATRPTLAEVLARLRENRRIPDHEDFRSWRAGLMELFAEDPTGASPQRPERTEIWRLPGEEEIRVLARPHPQGAVAFLFEDVSEAARLERRVLTESETRRAVMDRLEEAVAAFGPDGAARFANPAFAAMWGFRPGDPSGGEETLRLADAMRRFRSRSPSHKVWDRISDFFEHAHNRDAWSEQVELADGRRLRARVATLPDGSVLVAFLDITDATRAQTAMRERTAALQAAEEIRGALIEQLSSRLRTPLARISGLGQALHDEEAPDRLDKTQLARIDGILEAAAQMQEALTGVADLAAAQAGVLALSSEPVDLRAALVSALDVAERRARQRGVTLAQEVDATLGAGDRVTGDAARVRQLLFNLIADAVHRAPPGSEVRAGAAGRGEVVEIWTDEPVDPSRGSEGRLRGGLAHALVRRFAELHGGAVRLEKSEDGERLRVICALPIAALRLEGARGAAVA